MQLIVAVLLFRYVLVESNNVCVTFSDYYKNPNRNRKCYFNPEGDLEVHQIILRRGYPVEAYTTVTNDGYILTLFRIPHGRGSRGTNSPPVLLQHGMSLSSVSMVDRGDKSLGFLLADAGFDVWLGNFRGTQYSKGHVYLNPNSSEYWDFSFHELGVYDLPAKLKVISDVTGQKGNIIYLGFSMANTAGYVYNTVFPEDAAATIRLFVNLAPVTYIANTRTVLRHLIFVWEIMKSFAGGELQRELTRRDKRTTELLKALCLPYPFQMKLCSIPTMLLSGFDLEQMDPETLPVTTIQNTDSTSMKILAHYIQGIISGTFRRFDYGFLTNLFKYGSILPPRYNISAVRVPVYIVYANNDWLATEEDVLRLYQELPDEVKQHGVYKITYPGFTHSDFMVAKDIRPLLYDHLLQFLTNVSSAFRK